MVQIGILTKPVVLLVISICHMTSTKSSISLLVLVQIALEMVKTGELHKHIQLGLQPAAGAISSL
jgi:hypothetical protein